MFNKIEESIIILRRMDEDDYDRNSVEYKFVQKSIEINKRILARYVDDFVSKMSSNYWEIKKKISEGNGILGQIN